MKKGASGSEPPKAAMESLFRVPEPPDGQDDSRPAVPEPPTSRAAFLFLQPEPPACAAESSRGIGQAGGRFAPFVFSVQETIARRAETQYAAHFARPFKRQSPRTVQEALPSRAASPSNGPRAGRESAMSQFGSQEARKGRNDARDKPQDLLCFMASWLPNSKRTPPEIQRLSFSPPSVIAGTTPSEWLHLNYEGHEGHKE
jgi:hypothetical protein